MPTRAAAAGAAGGIPRLAAGLLLLVVVQQPLVSLMRIERPPYVSDYPMYADVNWTSKEEFVAAMYEEHYPRLPAIRLEPVGGDTSTFNGRLAEIDRNGAVREAAEVLASGERLEADQLAELLMIAERYRVIHGEPPPVRILTAGWRFEWQAAGFVPDDAWRVGPLLEWPERSSDAGQP